MASTSTNSKEGFSWALSAILAAIMTVDPALLSDDHVPYWAYGAKFLAILFAVRAISQLAQDPGDKKRMITFALVSAVFILLLVVAFALA
ncbi:hypothetical protein [Corynebacterium timonense]|uniref:Uncharacterized protein n=1 Tax=Corynebacterium timonense TaxID=441500 RepID=A0A1H1V056_9CORY|nr:hypothetical protein [Corynebacterium timonense]SDS78095.1 hypothetical protein SAMN04488539_2377 [Corynebacterium timonense]